MGQFALVGPRPSARYARSGDVHIAYQVLGDGPHDLVLVPGWVSHVEYALEDLPFSRFVERLASFARVIMLDRRGTGLSDRVATLPTLEERMDDVRAVMDAAGSERAALFGAFAAWTEYVMASWGTAKALGIFAPSVAGD